MNLEEKDLILHLQQRFALYEDMKAYKQLFDLLYNSLFKFSFSFVKLKEAAQEIVSDVFIKLWSIKTDLMAINNLKVYLYTITKNFSLNYITRHNKMQVVSLEYIEPITLFDYNNPETSLISSEVINRINQSIAELPNQCRIIFYLVKECGLKYKEVALILNISVHTVRNQVANAIRKIADNLPAGVHYSLTNIPRFSES